MLRARLPGRRGRSRTDLRRGPPVNTVTPDRIEVVPYDEEWPRLFSSLGASLRAALGDIALRIDHIGSTSVPGLAAKPIIDVQISVAALEPVEPYRLRLEGLELVFRADNPELTKRYFREPSGSRRTHIHVRQAGSWAEQFALLFRDYIRTHQEDALLYAELEAPSGRGVRRGPAGLHGGEGALHLGGDAPSGPLVPGGRLAARAVGRVAFRQPLQPQGRPFRSPPSTRSEPAPYLIRG